MSLDSTVLYNNIKGKINGKELHFTAPDGTKASVTIDIESIDQPGTQMLIKAIADAVVEYIHSNLEIVQGQFTLTGGNISGALIGTGGGPAPVAVTGGTVSSETGTVSIPPGAFK